MDLDAAFAAWLSSINIYFLKDNLEFSSRNKKFGKDAVWSVNDGGAENQEKNAEAGFLLIFVIAPVFLASFGKICLVQS
jgi:hypothetical protein